jgi:hypothetical protein
MISLSTDFADFPFNLCNLHHLWIISDIVFIIFQFAYI